MSRSSQISKIHSIWDGDRNYGCRVWGVGGEDVILMGWWGRAHWEEHISVKTRRMWGTLWGRTLGEGRKVTVRKNLEREHDRCVWGTARRPAQLEQRARGYHRASRATVRADSGLWVRWWKSLEECDPEWNDLTLWNRLTLTATLRDWQEADNGSKTGNGVFCPVPQSTSTQIKKKIPLT